MRTSRALFLHRTVDMGRSSLGSDHPFRHALRRRPALRALVSAPGSQGISGRSLNLLFWAHLVLGSVGAIIFAGRASLSRGSRNGLVITGMPKLIAHVGLGHLTLVCAVA
jgi:hypothetical protein